MITLRSVLLPKTREPLDANGQVVVPWWTFFSGLQKMPATALPDLPPTATNAQIVARLNAFGAILRANRLLDG